MPTDLDSAPSLERIVQIANEQGHSDVHLGVGESPRASCPAAPLFFQGLVAKDIVFVE